MGVCCAHVIIIIEIMIVIIIGVGRRFVCMLCARVEIVLDALLRRTKVLLEVPAEP